ncbi:hypothetical protein PUN28_016697 [Cardiocondyla obscurior]|uniref:Uncharacterized protein n=1 Tax=Cardiocondyla obscurior TaxID=286306 RepID=A0AAW2EQZ7_9HYME
MDLFTYREKKNRITSGKRRDVTDPGHRRIISLPYARMPGLCAGPFLPWLVDCIAQSPAVESVVTYLGDTSPLTFAPRRAALARNGVTSTRRDPWP